MGRSPSQHPQPNTTTKAYAMYRYVTKNYRVTSSRPLSRAQRSDLDRIAATSEGFSFMDAQGWAEPLGLPALATLPRGTSIFGIATAPVVFTYRDDQRHTVSRDGALRYGVWFCTAHILPLRPLVSPLSDDAYDSIPF